MRKPFQGVLNIIRFNWHFFVIAIILISILVITANYCSYPIRWLIYTACAFVSASIIISLLVSFYVYDLSGLYHLNWIEVQKNDKRIVNINAGFDETSALLQHKFKNAALVALDFYDPAKHTEVSIKRARKAYPLFPKTISVTTTALSLVENSIDKIFVILSAHEIRNENERVLFFKELYKAIKPGGYVFVTEHLRDIPNFLAYNIGFFHFYSKKSWHHTFKESRFYIEQEMKLTPFISTFILTRNGTTV
jgi:SAM-dependent methyltransferase